MSFYSKRPAVVVGDGPTFNPNGDPPVYIPPEPSSFTKKPQKQQPNNRTSGSSCCCKCCYELTFTTWMIIAGIILAALAITTICIYIAVNTNTDSVVRFCVEMTPAEVTVNNPSSTGELNTVIRGYFQLDSSQNTISYYFYTSPTLSIVQSITLRGPIPLLSTVGPVLFSFCGAPATYICDVLTTPGLIQNTGMTQVEPGPNDSRPFILDIRSNPSLYYVEVLTANNPTSPGALRSVVLNSCGLP